MVHFTCDLCGKDLTASGDSRYVVKIEAYPGFDPTQITEDDLEDDHMEAISELLQSGEGADPDAIEASARKNFRFDLCPCCHAKFVKDPLGRDIFRILDFSKN